VIPEEACTLSCAGLQGQPEVALDATSFVGRGCPCHLAGRSLRASCPALTPRKLASASGLSLACEAVEIARATPPPEPLTYTSPGREPGDCGNKRHPAIHAAEPGSSPKNASLGRRSHSTLSRLRGPREEHCRP